MAIIQPPSPLPLRHLRLDLRRPAQANRSGWTGRRQVVLLPGASRWSAKGEFAPRVGDANARLWRSFFVKLDGIANSFPLRVVEKQQTTAANPTISGAGQTGSSVALTGLTGSVGAVFLTEGSFLTLPLSASEVQLVVLTANLVIGAGGTGTATFKAPLRASPTTGGVVEAQYPYALMSMVNDTQGWDVDLAISYGFALEAEEAF